MSITNGTLAKQGMTDGVVDKLDLGSGAATGSLKIYTSGDVLLATLLLSNPAFGSANSSGVATANAITSATAVATGTAAKFKACDRDGNVVFEGSVATSGGDLTIDNASITSGQTVACSAWTHDAAGGD